MKNLVIAFCLLIGSVACSQDLINSEGQREALRRGSYVERIGFGPRGEVDAVAEITKLPENDNDKWFISIITKADCQYCEKLKADMASSPHLRAFVNPSDWRKSFAHYNVYRIDDQTQQWVFAKLQFTKFPTVLIQPPLSGKYGDSKTILPAIVGYDGDKALAKQLRDRMESYVLKYRKAIGASEVSRHELPFSLPLETDTRPLDQSQEATSALLSLATMFLPGTFTLTDYALIGTAIFFGIREMRKRLGKRQIVSDAQIATIEQIVESILAKKLTQQSPGSAS